jgi:hypothetical protein
MHRDVIVDVHGEDRLIRVEDTGAAKISDLVLMAIDKHDAQELLTMRAAYLFVWGEEPADDKQLREYCRIAMPSALIGLDGKKR